MSRWNFWTAREATPVPRDRHLAKPSRHSLPAEPGLAAQDSCYLRRDDIRRFARQPTSQIGLRRSDTSEFRNQPLDLALIELA